MMDLEKLDVLDVELCLKNSLIRNIRFSNINNY